MKELAKVVIALVVLGAVFGLAPHEPLARQGARNQRTNSAALPNNRVEIITTEEFREIRSNGIPDHEPGAFPNRRNPNAISAQNYSFRVPLEPRASRDFTRLRLGPFGVALNGVPFDPGAAEFWNGDFDSGWQYEAMSGAIDLGLDSSNAHVQPNGAYHYHGLPTGLIEMLGGGGRMLLIGYAADGFPVYAQYGPNDPNDLGGSVRKMRPSYRVKKGNRPSGPRGRYDGTFVEDYEYSAGSGDLDACNGRYGATPEYPEGTYHYFLTEDFPFIPRLLRGTPDPSFLRGAGPRGRSPIAPGARRRGPPAKNAPSN